MARSNVVKAGQGASGTIGKVGPIDMEHLDRQTLGDAGLRDEVLRLYANMSGVYLSRIQSSSGADELLEHIHTLRSAAAGIGAVQVRDRAAQVETSLRAGEAVEPARLLAIASAVAECQDYIRDLIAE